MATHSLSLLPISSYSSSSSFLQQREQPNQLVSKFGPNFTSLISPKISSSNSWQFTPIRRSSAVAAISFSLPTAEPERASSGKSPKWSARAIKSFAMAELEARKLKFPNTGTEALLMGILVEGTSLAAKFLRENGVTLSKVREETVKLLGRSDMYFFSPEHPPLTAPAQRAIDWAITEKLKSGETGEVTATHFLLGIWSEKESAGHKILTGFGFDDEKMKEIAKTMDKDYVLSFKKGV